MNWTSYASLYAFDFDVRINGEEKPYILSLQ